MRNLYICFLYKYKKKEFFKENINRIKKVKKVQTGMTKQVNAESTGRP